MRKLAVDLRELRRPGTGIGRWISNALDAKRALAPDIRVLGLGGYREGVDVALDAPAGPWIGARLNRMLEREKAGLWLSPYFKIPPGLGIPALATVHDTIPATILHRRLAFTWRLRMTLKAAAGIVTVSEASRRDLIENWGVAPERIVLALNSAGRVFTPAPAPDDRRALADLGLEPRSFFLVVSDDRPHKNLETLIQAFSGRSMPPVVVAGTRREDLPAPFIRMPDVNDRRLAALYRNARALLHPALMEGFGLPALEAMACGSAVILADIPSLREIAGDLARYVEPRDVQGWRAAVADPPAAGGVLERAALFGGERTYYALWEEIRRRLEA